MSPRWPDATASTHPQLRRMATALNQCGLSHIERLQVLLERVAPTYHSEGPEAAAKDLETVIRQHQYIDRHTRRRMADDRRTTPPG
jgi:hypothetical protein